jgi:hypothetical protein
VLKRNIIPPAFIQANAANAIQPGSVPGRPPRVDGLTGQGQKLTGGGGVVGVPEPSSVNNAANKGLRPRPTKPPSDPAFWRKVMSVGRLDAETSVLNLDGVPLTWPPLPATPGLPGMCVLMERSTGKVVYRGPGAQEVFPPPGGGLPPAGASKAVCGLYAWATDHGWFDIEKRLITAGGLQLF